MHSTSMPAPVLERHLYRIPEALRLLSMSRSVFYEELRAKRLRTVKQGRTRLVPAKAIHDYVQMLIDETSEEVTYGKTA